VATGQRAELAAKPPPWREVFRGRLGRLTAGLLLLEAIVAIQQLIVATIMPAVRRDLGMVQLYGLVFTAFGLATFASIPIAGRAVDRFGASRVFPPAASAFAAGLLIAAAAPTMPILLAGQFLAGAGGGALYSLSIGSVAKAYPDRLRARVLALLASMWILPGLIGPPVGAAITSAVGWRWAFVAPIPLLLIGAWMIAPALDLVPAGSASREELPVRWPLQLMVGAGLFFSSLTIVQWWSSILLVTGLLIGLPALIRIVPPGTLRARPGIPSSALAAFLLSLGFLAVDAFLTLMLTGVRGLSLGAAGVAITAASLTWAGGSLWQSGRTQRMSLQRLVLVGTLLAILGAVAVSATLIESVPLVVAFVGWAITGLGMGISFPTIPLAAMRQAGQDEEAGELSSVLLMDMLGVATGAGLGGGAVAVSAALEAPIAAGIAGAFALGIFAWIALVPISQRIEPGGN
jgi:MFS family permease